MPLSANFALFIVSMAAAITAMLVVLCRPVLVYIALAKPNARSSHREPTPQGGGAPTILATLLVSLAAASIVELPKPAIVQLYIVFGAAVFLAIVGAIDDIRTVQIFPRLAAQAIAAATVISILPETIRLTPFVPWWAERAVLLVALLWFINLTNFMDGIDWMTVAEFVPATLGLAVIGFLGALPSHATIIALALLGAMLGFAPFNRPVARLFLGDVGSLPLGLLLSFLLVLLAGNGHFAAALLLPLYYIADATITLFRRIASSERFWNAHRSHFYQRALDGGMPIESILTLVFLTNAALVILAILSILNPSVAVGFSCVAAGAALVTMLLIHLARSAR